MAPLSLTSESVGSEYEDYERAGEYEEGFSDSFGSHYDNSSQASSRSVSNSPRPAGGHEASESSSDESEPRGRQATSGVRADAQNSVNPVFSAVRVEEKMSKTNFGVDAIADAALIAIAIAAEIVAVADAAASDIRHRREAEPPAAFAGATVEESPPADCIEGAAGNYSILPRFSVKDSEPQSSQSRHSNATLQSSNIDCPSEAIAHDDGGDNTVQFPVECVDGEKAENLTLCRPSQGEETEHAVQVLGETLCEGEESEDPAGATCISREDEFCEATGQLSCGIAPPESLQNGDTGGTSPVRGGAAGSLPLNLLLFSDGDGPCSAASSTYRSSQRPETWRNESSAKDRVSLSSRGFNGSNSSHSRRTDAVESSYSQSRSTDYAESYSKDLKKPADSEPSQRNAGNPLNLPDVECFEEHLAPALKEPDDLLEFSLTASHRTDLRHDQLSDCWHPQESMDGLTNALPSVLEVRDAIIQCCESGDDVLVGCFLGGTRPAPDLEFGTDWDDPNVSYKISCGVQVCEDELQPLEQSYHHFRDEVKVNETTRNSNMTSFYRVAAEPQPRPCPQNAGGTGRFNRDVTGVKPQRPGPPTSILGSTFGSFESQMAPATSSTQFTLARSKPRAATRSPRQPSRLQPESVPRTAPVSYKRARRPLPPAVAAAAAVYGTTACPPAPPCRPREQPCPLSRPRRWDGQAESGQPAAATVVVIERPKQNDWKSEPLRVPGSVTPRSPYSSGDFNGMLSFREARHELLMTPKAYLKHNREPVSYTSGGKSRPKNPIGHSRLYPWIGVVPVRSDPPPRHNISRLPWVQNDAAKTSNPSALAFESNTAVLTLRDNATM